MRPLIAALLLLLTACSPPKPLEEPGLDLDQCIARLFRRPDDPDARARFPALLQLEDDETMRTMRYSHGTGDLQMNYNYPSHRWIHPFLRGCRFQQEGKHDQAEFAWESARTAVRDNLHWGSEIGENLGAVIAEEARRRIAELPLPR